MSVFMTRLCAGEWTSQPDFSLRKTPLHELAGKTMGIVGLGRIGEHSAELRARVRNERPGARCISASPDVWPGRGVVRRR